jgi:hypothetical protein
VTAEPGAWVAAALRDAADLIDRGPDIPLPPSVYSALLREHAEKALADGGSGPIEYRVRADIERLGDLPGVTSSLAELAYRLAESLDSSDKLEGRELAPVAAQLRATLEAIAEAVGDDDDPNVAGLSTPIYGGGGTTLPAAVGNAPQAGPADAGAAGS